MELETAKLPFAIPFETAIMELQIAKSPFAIPLWAIVMELVKTILVTSKRGVNVVICW